MSFATTGGIGKATQSLHHLICRDDRDSMSSLCLIWMVMSQSCSDMISPLEEDLQSDQTVHLSYLVSLNLDNEAHSSLFLQAVLYVSELCKESMILQLIIGRTLGETRGIFKITLSLHLLNSRDERDSMSGLSLIWMVG